MMNRVKSYNLVSYEECIWSVKWLHLSKRASFGKGKIFCCSSFYIYSFQIEKILFLKIHFEYVLIRWQIPKQGMYSEIILYDLVLDSKFLFGLDWWTPFIGRKVGIPRGILPNLGLQIGNPYNCLSHPGDFWESISCLGKGRILWPVLS